jgi:hypothetical protein
MQPSQPDLAVAPVEESRAPSARKVIASAVGAGLLALGLSLCDVAPITALVLGLVGLLAVGLGQVKGPTDKSIGRSLRAAVLVSARMDSIVDNAPPSSKQAPPGSRGTDKKR